MRLRLVTPLFLACLAAGAERPVSLVAEATQAGEFRKVIGSGLVFVLTPDGAGWKISVGPVLPTSSKLKDFAWVVNPPFRARNALYLNTDYGVPAVDAVRMPYDFNFVLNEPDYRRENEWVNRAL